MEADPQPIEGSVQERMPDIPEKMYFRIGDVADIVGVKPYVIRFWETEFPFLSPQKSQTGQRVYKKADVEVLLLIKHLLYQERYSIEGARKRIRELRKEGELEQFKKERVLGGEAQVAQRERMKQIREELAYLIRECRTPLHDLFKI